MNILFIGNYQSGPGGEPADETHITRELESNGATVTRVNRDEWREYVLEDSPKDKYKIPEEGTFDAAVICKWHHFYDGRFIEAIREKYNCPVFYWVWDYMPNPILPDWHVEMVQAADLYLGNDVMSGHYADTPNAYYFNFDVIDGDIPTFVNKSYTHDVTFLGSHLQQGNRIEYLTALKDAHVCNIDIFATNYEEWQRRGFNAYPAVYGEEANRVIAESKINIGFSVEAHCWGYWSNRVGRVIHAGGFLLYEYAPGMEQLLKGNLDCFSNIDEMIKKVDHYIHNDSDREGIRFRSNKQFTSLVKSVQLIAIIDRFISGGKQCQLR